MEIERTRPSLLLLGLCLAGGLPRLSGFSGQPQFLGPGASVGARPATCGRLPSATLSVRAQPARSSSAGGAAGGGLGVAHEARDASETGGEYVSILRETVNRGCNVSLMGRVYGNYKKRKLNIEHIVPRAVIMAAAGNSSSVEDAASKDLYNMFLAVPDINRARRDYKFSPEPFGGNDKKRPTIIYGKLNSKKRKYSENARDVWWSLGSGLFVNDRLSRFVPRTEDRGVIGRAILHMCLKWGCDADHVIDGGRDTAEQWHFDNPPGVRGQYFPTMMEA